MHSLVLVSHVAGVSDNSCSLEALQVVCLVHLRGMGPNGRCRVWRWSAVYPTGLGGAVL